MAERKKDTAVEPILVATFYKFIKLTDRELLQHQLETCCRSHNVLGIILLAPEGINATIAGSDAGVRAVLEYLCADTQLSDLKWKESCAAEQPFGRLRVRLKKEIITMGVPDIDPTQLVGTYVKPSEWNALIRDPDVMVIDTRNDYEVEIGTFKGAINPDLQSFGQLPEWVEQKIDAGARPRVAMFCTGGIRCEKSTAYLKQAGIQEVYHLEGGILKYLEEIPEEDSLWEGQCFVFDKRVSVGHGLKVGDYQLCRACRFPLSHADMRSSKYKEGISCPRCHDKTSHEQKARFAERQKQHQLACARGERHIMR